MSQPLALAFVSLAGCAFHGSGKGSLDDGPLAIDARVIDAAPPIDVPDGFTFMDAPPDARPDAFVTPLTCPAGYAPVNGRGMYREGASASWTVAAADCNDDTSIGGPYTGFTHLAVLRDETERIGITNSGTTISGNTWIGLTDSASEGVFVWVTNEPTAGYPIVTDKPPWDSDDPDDAGGNEDCARFKNSFVFEDKPCDMAMSYLCECDAFPPN